MRWREASAETVHVGTHQSCHVYPTHGWHVHAHGHVLPQQRPPHSRSTARALPHSRSCMWPHELCKTIMLQLAIGNDGCLARRRFKFIRAAAVLVATTREHTMCNAASARFRHEPCHCSTELSL